jgi:hypothetical protein
MIKDISIHEQADGGLLDATEAALKLLGDGVRRGRGHPLRDGPPEP